MANERLGSRRAAVVQDANFIGTFWLRTSLLPEPARSEAQARLRRYLDLHFEHREAIIDEDRTESIEAEAARLQKELWDLVLEDARSAPEARRQFLLMPALSTMLDDTASVLAATENRLPDAVFSIFSFCPQRGAAIAYWPPGEKRNLLLWGAFTAVVSGVLIILIDIDRPRRGLIETDMTPFVRLSAEYARWPKCRTRATNGLNPAEIMRQAPSGGGWSRG